MADEVLRGLKRSRLALALPGRQLVRVSTRAVEVATKSLSGPVTARPGAAGSEKVRATHVLLVA